MGRRGVYPGSFDPLTVAHLAVAEAALTQRDLAVVVFTLSKVTLTKEDRVGPSAHERADRLRRAVATKPWAEVAVVEEQLIVDIAVGYDVVIMGADKWRQVNDPQFYRHSPTNRDQALERLPEVAVAPRSGDTVPPRVALEVPAWLSEVSATAVRDGADHWRA